MSLPYIPSSYIIGEKEFNYGFEELLIPIMKAYNKQLAFSGKLSDWSREKIIRLKKSVYKSVAQAFDAEQGFNAKEKVRGLKPTEEGRDTILFWENLLNERYCVSLYASDQDYVGIGNSCDDHIYIIQKSTGKLWEIPRRKK